MGGYGSGYRGPAKRTVESCHYIRANELKPIVDDDGVVDLKPLLDAVGVSDFKTQRLQTVKKRVGYGERLFVLCPYCRKPKVKLYERNSRLACRTCQNLQYYTSGSRHRFRKA